MRTRNDDSYTRFGVQVLDNCIGAPDCVRSPAPFTRDIGTKHAKATSRSTKAIGAPVDLIN
jgi:hypothetical protein